MLTHVGETVSNAMQQLAALNQEIADLHKEIAEVEAQIQGAEDVEAEVEPVAHETSK